MNQTIVVDALADVHKHLRECALHAPLIELAIAGGADVLGLQPNTKSGLRTAGATYGYWKRAETVPLSSPDIARPAMLPFVMITEDTTPQMVDDCVARGILDGKVYPRFRTTQSEHGVVRYGWLLPIIKHCGRVGMRAHLHPEHPNTLFSNRDAEYAFLALAEMFLQETDATIVWEHGTDVRCVPHWIEMAESGRFFVTLTAHHLATNEDEVFGDVRAACKPPIKTEWDRCALVDLVFENDPWVMAGGDDAFHPKRAKHTAEGRCACGAFTGPFLLPLYAHALDSLLQTTEGISTFVDFTSRNARQLYQLPPARQVRLERTPWEIPLEYRVGSEIGMPFWAGETINWRIVK